MAFIRSLRHLVIYYLFLVVLVYSLVRKYGESFTEADELEMGRRLGEIKVSTDIKIKKTSNTNVNTQQRAAQFVRLTRDLMLVNIILLCGDILSNPGPGKTQCATCLKTIRRNQGQATCSVCSFTHHFKCLSASFEDNKTCLKCSVPLIGSISNDSLANDMQCEASPELLEALKCRGMRFIHQNIRSLRGKFGELQILLSNCPDLHVIALTETWLDHNIHDGEIALAGYKLYRNDRPTGTSGGGTAVYVKETLNVIRRADLEVGTKYEATWLEILLPKSQGILFGAVYRPPSQSDFMEQFHNCLEAACAENKELIVTGDFNCDFLAKRPTLETKTLKNILLNFSLTQVIKVATRITRDTSTLIDLFLTTHPNNITFASVGSTSLSDHDMIVAVRKTNANKQPPRTINCRSYANYSRTAFCNDLLSVPWDDVLKKEDVNEAWELWEKLFVDKCEKHAPLVNKKVRGQCCPWLTSDLKKLMNERDHYLKKARRSGSEIDWSTYRRLRNQTANRIKYVKGKYHQNLLHERVNDSKSFWKTIKTIFPSKKGTDMLPDAVKETNGIITDKVKLAEKFNRFFSTVVENLTGRITSSNTEPLSTAKFTDKSFVLNTVSQAFIQNQLEKMKEKKATGLDNIPACLVKDSAYIISHSLTHVINLSLATGVVPTEWKKARVVPVYKAGDREDYNNYRPISILPVISKIMEKVVSVQLQRYLQEYNLLTPSQSGFRAKYSTQTAVTYFCDTILRNMDMGKMTGAVFVDLKKAFDTVPHDGLLLKLHRFGIKDNAMMWFENYLTERTQVVSIGNQLSDAMSINSGVPQGSILGPLLFIMYINDLPSCIQFSSVAMYADDTVLYFASSLRSEIEMNLNSDLINLSRWLDGNKLVLNMKKTELIIFGTRQRLSLPQNKEFDVSFDGVAIKRSESFKYLGVVLDQSLTFNEHIDYVKKKVSKSLGMFLRVRSFLTTEAANRLYKTTILSAFDYCDVTWHNSGKGNSDILESLQRRACRIVCRDVASNELSNGFLLQCLGWELLYERRENHVLELVQRCVDGNVPEYFKNYFTKRHMNVHDHLTRSRFLLYQERVKLEHTKLAFFYKGTTIFNRNL